VSKVKQHALYLSASRGLTVGSARFFFKNLDPLFLRFCANDCPNSFVVFHLSSC